MAAQISSSPAMLVCSQCDALFSQVRLRPSERVLCSRCGHELFREARRRYHALLPIVITALITFLLCNLFPIVEIQIRGLSRQTTLYESTWVLWQDGRHLAALMVFLPTIAFPALELSLMFFVLWYLRLGQRPPGFSRAIRFIQHIRPWGMLEVFMLGVVASLVKLASMATLVPGIALWSFAAMTVLVAIIISFNPSWLWLHPAVEAGSAPPAQTRVTVSAKTAAPTANETGLLSCKACNAIWPLSLDGEACPRCEARLRARQPNSLAYCWAFLLAAVALYGPANLLPVMVTGTLLGEQYNTIIGGVIYLWRSGSYLVAGVVFAASVVIPLFKLGALLFLTISVQCRMQRWAAERTRLYRMVEVVGRWSMVDVFVVALLASLVQMGALATVRPEAGVAAFGAVVILTMFASHYFDPRLIWDSQTHHEHKD